MTWEKNYKNELPVLAMLEDGSFFDGSSRFCDETGRVPLFRKSLLYCRQSISRQVLKEPVKAYRLFFDGYRSSCFWVRLPQENI